MQLEESESESESENEREGEQTLRDQQMLHDRHPPPLPPRPPTWIPLLLTLAGARPMAAGARPMAAGARPMAGAGQRMSRRIAAKSPSQ